LTFGLQIFFALLFCDDCHPQISDAGEASEDDDDDKYFVDVSVSEAEPSSSQPALRGDNPE